jgi:hypothetical protein
MPMYHPHLEWRGRKTLAWDALQQAKKEPGGLAVTRRRGLNNNFHMLHKLAMFGFLEVKSSGPRGGVRFHITREGLIAIGESPLRIAAIGARKKASSAA